MSNDLFLGEFSFNGRTYEVIEDDYLVDGIEELTEIDDIINAAKHAAIQRMSAGGSAADNLSELRGDYHFTSDPIDWEGIVLIIDANNLAHRARYTFQLSYKMWDVSVTYGFLSILAATVRKFANVTSIIVCWDGGVPQFRYDCTPGYKRRDHSGEEDYQEFLRQIKELQAFLPSLGVYSLRKLKTEADDLIYHAARLIHADYRKVIVSTDQDLLQCVRSDVDVWQPTKEQLINRANFAEYTGMANVNDFLVYRSMVGDSSDGVTGIKGIGEKIAQQLIGEYGASPSNLVNVATGANTTVKPMTPAIADKIRSYGLKGFADTMTTIRLDRDRCGARLYLRDALKQPCDYDHTTVVNYLKKYAFVSLLDAQFWDCFKELRRPVLTNVEMRYPRVLLSERQPAVA